MPTEEQPLPPQDPPVMGRPRPYGNRLFGAIFLIGLGIAIFLDNIGILSFQEVWRFWPLYLIGVGIVKASSGRSAQDRSWGVILIVGGTLFLGWNLGIYRLRGNPFNWAAGIILVGLGLRNLFYPNSTGLGRRRRRVLAGDSSAYSNSPDSEPVISSVAIFGSSKRRVTNPAFQGGDAQAIFGNVEFDLRQASIQPGTQAVIDAQSIFGSVKVRVPYHWRVSLQAQGALGSAEDKTVPDPRSTETGPLLVITGTYLFGSIEVEN